MLIKTTPLSLFPLFFNSWPETVRAPPGRLLSESYAAHRANLKWNISHKSPRAPAADKRHPPDSGQKFDNLQMPIFSSPAPSARRESRHLFHSALLQPTMLGWKGEGKAASSRSAPRRARLANEHPSKKSRQQLDFRSRKKESTLKVNEVQIYDEMTFIKWFSSSFRRLVNCVVKWFNGSDKVGHDNNLAVILRHFIICSSRKPHSPARSRNLFAQPV